MKHETPPDEALERIVEAHCAFSSGGPEKYKVRFRVRHMHDAVNYTLNGEIEVDGEIYGFLIDDGNWNGTQVREWALAEDVGYYEPPRVEPMTFVPNQLTLPLGLMKVYFAWRKEEWFKKLEGDYNYDRTFAPGGKTEAHYRAKAAKRGIRIGSMEDVRQWQATMEKEERGEFVPIDQLMEALQS